MLVLGVNKILKWCQIVTISGTYTCPTKIIDGVLHFRFKNQWHKVIDFISEHAEELIEENGRIFSRKYRE